jgi:hypothetical protein
MLYFCGKFESNIIYAEPEKVPQYLTLTLWANHYSWPMRNNHLFLIDRLFLLRVLSQGTCENVNVYQPKGDSECISVKIFIQNVLHTRLQHFYTRNAAVAI